MTYKESQAQNTTRPRRKKTKWTDRLDRQEDPAPKEVPQEATAPVNKTVIAVLRIVKIVLRISIPQATKALIQK